MIRSPVVVEPSAVIAAHSRALATQLQRLARVVELALRGDHTGAARELDALHEHRSGLDARGFATLRRGLAEIDLDLLLLAAATRLDLETRGLLAGAGHIVDGVVTAGGALRVLVPSYAERIERLDDLARGPLVEHRLLRRPTRDGLDAELVPTRRALSTLQGRDLLDLLPDWAAVRRPGAPPELEEDPAAHASLLRRGGVLLITGASGAGKTELARAIAGELAALTIEVDGARARVTHSAQALGPAINEIMDDAELLGLPLILDDAHEALAPGDPASPLVAARLARATTPILILSPDAGAVSPRIVSRARARIELGVPSPCVRARIWGAHLDDSSLAQALGDELELMPRQIVNAAAAARAGVPVRTAAIRQIAAPANLLQPTAVRAGLDQIVLGADARAELTEIIAAVRARGEVLHVWGLGQTLARGRGLSALFSGESGTGKTMACEVVAAETGLPLLRVNAATLVDKYIGETEKNLARAFAQARAAGAILLFDEADALFGARTEVKGANDRYANLETNVLLQLMEEHTGVVLLTTNLKRNIDPAFLRRIAFKVDFEAPDGPVRADIWRVTLRAVRTAGEVDCGRLGRTFPLAGGAIKSAVLRAAYRAAAAGRATCMGDLLACAELECQALGMVISQRSE